MGFEKVGKPNKVTSPPKRPTADVQSRLNTYTGKNSHGKEWPVLKVTMKGRLK